MTWSFFDDCKTTHLGVINLPKKLVLHIFQVWLFNFNAILTHYAATPQNGQIQQLTNCLSVFDHFVGMALEGLETCFEK